MIADDRLSVLGRAEGELAPDRIEWTLIVHERDADARATAERMASAAGRTLGRVVSVRDPRADEADGHFYGVAASGGGHDGPPVIARPQRLSVAVAVVFELGDPG